jgi:type VI secretion system secreted protein VgrG
MATSTVGARLLLDGRSVSIASMRLDEGISRPIEAHAEIACQGELDVAALGGAAATVELLVDDVVARSWSLLIGRIAFRRISKGSLRYDVNLYAPVWLLRHTLSTRKFRQISAKDIVTQLFGETSIAHDWRIGREPPQRKYCAQYRESHFDFASRLLEFEGIFYTTQSDGTLRLEDDSPACPSIVGDASYELLGHAAALTGEVGIHRFGWGARVSSGKASVNDYNWKTPRVSLLQSAAAERDSELETYDYPAGYRQGSAGAYQAQIRLEAHRARTKFARGGSNVVTLMPARTVTIDGEQLLLTDVVHEVYDPAFGEAAQKQANYANQYEAIPASVKYRAAQSTPRPTVQGSHTAMVRGPVGEEIHTDKYGRFRAQFHWDRDAVSTDEDSRWLRKLQEASTGVNLARVGWEVSVAHVDGDPDRPIGLARQINGKMLPAYGQPASKQLMTIKTPTYPGGGGYNEIKLDDSAAAMRFDVRAERDYLNYSQNNKTEKVGNNETRTVDGLLANEVQRDQQLSVGADQQWTIAEDQGLIVAKDRTETIAGNQNVEADGSISVAVNGDDKETVGSVRLSIVGCIKPPDIMANAKAMVPGKSAAAGAAKGAASAGAQAIKGGGGLSGAASAAGGSMQGSLKSMVPTPEGAASQLTGGLSTGDLTALASGSINRGADKKLSRTVGGVYLAASGGNVDATAKYVYAETVGGVKLTAAGADISESVGDVMALTVGGAVIRKAKGDMGYGSDLAKVTVGGLVQLSSDERIEIQGKAVAIEAKTSLTFKRDGLELSLEPSKMSFKGALRLEASDKVTITGSDDNLTKV